LDICLLLFIHSSIDGQFCPLVSFSYLLNILLLRAIQDREMIENNQTDKNEDKEVYDSRILEIKEIANQKLILYPIKGISFHS